ncbi:hypothetical protein F4804DRAFT_311584 [Jackrogersella minutella]|nr:hypothetical protein F4804DRAFT_311584 [Jackrogersella minutella]
MGSYQRAHIMGVAIGIKSILFILYQLLSEHTQVFRKWASKKANFILSCLDMPFWGAMAFMLIQANTKSCIGTSCAISWVLTVLAIVLIIISHWVAGCTYFEYRYYGGRKTVADSVSV